MPTIFSIRHRRALSDGSLTVDIDETTRMRLWRLMQRCNETYHYQPDPDDNWTEQTDHLTELPTRLLDNYGEVSLWPVSGKVPDTSPDFGDWIRETHAERVLDALEIFLGQLSSDAKRASCAGEINDVLQEQDSPWRLLGNRFVLLDSVFVHTELVQRTEAMLGHAKFEGSVRELSDAQHDLVAGATRGSIHNAGSSYESTMKAMLEREDGTAKALIEGLLADGVFDGLPERHRAAFITNVLSGLPWLRNRFGGHGRGRELADLPVAYGRLAIGLAAVLSEFLVRLHLDRVGETEEAGVETQDFLASTSPLSADDDIPF